MQRLAVKGAAKTKLKSNKRSTILPSDTELTRQTQAVLAANAGARALVLDADIEVDADDYD